MYAGDRGIGKASYNRAHVPNPREADAGRARSALVGGLGGTRHLPFRPQSRARRDLLDRHAAAHGERLVAHGFRVRLRADRLPSPATSACAGATCSIRWAGTTTGCPPSGASRTTSACAASRTSRTTPRSCRRRSRARTSCRSRGPTSSSSARSWWPRTRLRSRISGAARDSRSTGRSRTRRSGTRRAARVSGRSCATSPRGEAYQADAPTLWDVDFRTAVAQAELEDREMPGAYHALRFHKADGSGDLLIDTTRPELLAACVAVVAHPDDDRFRPLFGSEVVTPLYGARCRCRAPSRRSREGDRHRDDLHLRRHHRRRLVARAATADAGRARHRRPVQVGAARGTHRRGRRRVRRHRGPERQAGPEDRRGAAGRVGRAGGRAPPDHTPGEVLREGRAPARDRHVPPVVPAQRRAATSTCRAELLALGKELRWHPPTCGSATTAGSRG